MLIQVQSLLFPILAGLEMIHSTGSSHVSACGPTEW